MKCNQDNFDKIIELNNGIFISICRTYTNTNEDFEYLYQEVLFTVWKALPSFKAKSKLSTWIYKVSLNVAMKFALKNNNKTQTLDFFDTKISDHSIVNTIEINESIDMLYQCISRLSIVEKSLITLYLDDLAYAEIADILGISENLVAVKVKRIKVKLLECLKMNNYER